MLNTLHMIRQCESILDFLYDVLEKKGKQILQFDVLFLPSTYGRLEF